jgi:FtsP/CotA-like multicopper oxidase with cupredoxin domain
MHHHQSTIAAPIANADAVCCGTARARLFPRGKEDRMISRRQFVRTMTVAGAGVVWSCSDRGVRAVSRLPASGRVAGSGPAILRSAGSHLNAELHVAASDAMLGGHPARLFAFNGQVPGPLLEARPGDDVTIRLNNDLGEPTNLHFHGLHIPPTGAADNIFLQVSAGESYTYRFVLPRNHPAGLFWIHPHLHGSVARQVSHGLAAPFVIRGEIDAIPEVAAAEEHILLLQDFELDRRGSVIEPSMPELMHGREGSTIAVGGAINPVIPIRQDGLLRLRLINASSSRFYRLRLEEHPLHLIGVDGGALGAVRTLDEILFLPGQRLDILIEGARAAGSFRLLNLPYDRGSGEMMGGGMGGMMGGRATPAAGHGETLATIEYRGRAERKWTVPERLGGAPAVLPAGTRPPRTFQLGQGMMMGRGMSFTINGQEFDANRIDAAPRLDSVEEWLYVNSTAMDHPMHLHTNPFQIVGDDGVPEAAWRDIMLVKAGQRAHFRVRFDDFAGKIVHHCHILDHEDQGMMATVEIQN